MSCTPRSFPELTISTRSLRPPYTTQLDAQSPYPSSLHRIYRVMAISWARPHHISHLGALVHLFEQQCEVPRHSDHRWIPRSRSFWLVPVLVLLHSGLFFKKGPFRSESVISVGYSTDSTRSSGREVGHALLYYGCHSQADALYSAELGKWEEEGIVSVRFAFSRDVGTSNGSRYVQ